MRIGIIGYGSAGRRHAANILVLDPEAQLVLYDAVPSRLPTGLERTASVWEWNCFADFNYDAVIIASPIMTHLGYLREAADRGWRVLCEKPICGPGQIDDAAAIINRLTGICGYNWLWHQGVADMRAEVARGDIGRLRRVMVALNTDMRQWPGMSYGAPLWECSHDLAVLREWLGPLTVLQASEGQARGSAGNVKWVFRCNVFAHPQTHGRRWEIEGDVSTLEYQFAPQSDQLDESYRRMIASFFTQPNRWIHPGLGLEAAVSVARVCERIDQLNAGA